MATLEAQAAGLPVIAGNFSGVRQIFRDGKTGILAKEGNIKDFADTAGSLLTDSTRRFAMGEVASRVAKRGRSPEQASKTLDSILVDSKKGKAR